MFELIIGKLKKHWAILFQITFLLLAAFVIFSIANTENVTALLLEIRVEFFIFSITIFAFQSVLAAMRQWLLLRILAPQVSLGAVVDITFAGLFLGQFLPSGLGADIVKFSILRFRKIPTAHALQAITNDRVFTLIFFIILSALFAPLVLSKIADPVYLRVIVISLSLFILACAVILLLQTASVARLVNIRFIKPVLEQTVNFFPQLNKKLMLKYICVSLVTFALMAVSLLVVAAAIEVHVEFSHLILFLPFIVLLSSVPISIGGWGLREFSFILLFGTVSLDADQAIALSVAWGTAGLISYSAGYATVNFVRLLKG